MNVAIYLRLSSEDADNAENGKLESESISNQRGLLLDYMQERPEFAGAEVMEFCDDGWSGKNFERPSFQKMMERVKQGGIQVIIVKDISRFGRDYIVVGNYLSRVFPFMGVRFIAVNDGFDSSRPQDIDSLDASFKMLIYDLYSRDLSTKVKDARRQIAQTGAFVSPFAPYGYRKDPAEKRRLIIDPEAAEVVRTIFHLAANGTRSSEIATRLNRDGVLTPMQYKRAAGCSRGRWPSVSENNFWTGTAVTTILNDERYTGCAVYGKRVRNIVGSTHTVKVPREDWTTVANAHEAIIQPEMFVQAQNILRTTAVHTLKAHREYPLSRKVYCGVCGHAMRRNNRKAAAYYCPTRKFVAEYDCPQQFIPEADILNTVLSAIRSHARIAVELEHLSAAQAGRERLDWKQAQRELASLQGKHNYYEKRLQEIYEAMADAKITRESYATQRTGLQAQIQKVNADLSALEQKLLPQEPDSTMFIAKYRDYTELDALTAEVASDLLERVTVYSDCVLEVQLKYCDELARRLENEREST